jgi:hypothetical protein
MTTGVEQLGVGSGTEGVQAIREAAFDLSGTAGKSSDAPSKSRH